MSHLPHVPSFLRRQTHADTTLAKDKKGKHSFHLPDIPYEPEESHNDPRSQAYHSSAAVSGLGRPTLPPLTVNLQPPQGVSPVTPITPATPALLSAGAGAKAPKPKKKGPEPIKISAGPGKKKMFDPADMLHGPTSLTSNPPRPSVAPQLVPVLPRLPATSHPGLTSPEDELPPVVERDYADEDKSQHTYRPSRKSKHRYSNATNPEDGFAGDGATSPRSRSPPTSPRSMRSPTLEEGLGAEGPPVKVKRKSPRVPKSSSTGSPDDEKRRRPKSTRSKASPTNLKTEDDSKLPPQPHPFNEEPSELYPGVKLGVFEGTEDDGGMVAFGDKSGPAGIVDDIVDMSVHRTDGRHDSHSGPIAPNVAPWLQDVPEEPASVYESSVGPRIKSDSGGRDPGASTSSSRSGSHPDIFPVPPPGERHHSSGNSSAHEAQESGRSRHGSTDSVQTLSGYQQSQSKKRSGTMQSEFVPPGGGRSSYAGGSRLSRLGSTASNFSGSSAGSEKKKGFLGGLLKRKGTGVPMVLTDFNPSDGSMRGSETGSGSSKMSGSGSMGSLTTKRSFPELSPASPSGFRSRQTSYFGDDLISPMEEKAEPDFTLDMNLEDMEGIVDQTRSATSHPSVSTATNTGTTYSSLGLQDAQSNQSFATTISRDGSSGGSIGSAGPTPGRQVVGEADRQGHQFSQNPFGGSVQAQAPSPQNLSPKNVVAHHPALSNQPRRPSQLRNMKKGSFDSETEDAMQVDNSGMQPLAPAWAAQSSNGQTVFNDPFQGATQRPQTADGQPDGTIPSAGGLAPPVGQAAWAAPESWGVEGDEDEEEGQETSSSSGEEDGWTAADEEASGTEGDDDVGDTLQKSPKKPPPFGFASRGGRGGVRGLMPPGRGFRGRGMPGRQSTVYRPEKMRPGTSGSTHGPGMPHWIRIYRADGTFTVMAFPLLTSTAEIINVLSGANEAPPGKKVTTSMRMYLRERGQDRMLLPAEKPLAIQDRRLRQAGFTDGEKIEELGKEDLAILCKFIYQTPVLPIMDPDEENQYDSFEFIDLAGRDLQTIPIFLHLHAHNIIILNISKNPMTDIPLDFIQACTALKELRMSNMALKRVPISIKASTSLARLDVSSNRIADLDSVNLHEIGTLLSLKVQNNKLTSIPTYFAQMKALKYLNISNNKFDVFPLVVCEMSNLIDLDLSFNTISELPSEMSNLGSLEKLAVFGNDISKFPDSFSTLANLRDLDVRRNKLTDLATVYALPNLTRLQADWNEIVTLDAQLGAKVRTFSVPHNSITRFTLAPLPGATAVEYSLTQLNLSHAKISTLADEALSGLVNLVDLNLNFNQFTRLPATLERLTNLEVFSCTDNALNDLPMGFGKMQKLRLLNVHNNNLRTLPPDIWGCGSLERLNASSNLIQQLEEPPADLVTMMGPEAAATAARKMSIVAEPGQRIVMNVPPAGLSLQRLYLGDNTLNDDVFHQIAQMPELQILNLSFNDIYEIPPGTLPHNHRLEALYLSGNKLTSLPSEDLEKLQRLQILHLNGNKLQTLPSELGAIKTLQHLDVGSNVLKYNIANWPYDWNWNWNTSLRYLNLSGNKRLEIKPTSGQEMSHGGGFRKELSDFTALGQLRILGLMDVTLRISNLPDESEEKRVRTSFAEVNDMRYGISDMLGSNDHLALFDMVTPNFRGKNDECVFGMFGRSKPTLPSGKIPKFLQESFPTTFSNQLEKLAPGEDPTAALRRSFLFSDRKTFDYLMGANEARKRSVASFTSTDSMFKNWAPSPNSHFRTGASGAVVYLVGKMMYVGSVGANLVVLSRKGEAELLTTLHDPTVREETARIRRAEAWVSPKGLINEDKELDISRAFGYWHQYPAVNASPDIAARLLTEADEFIIIGNRSLWNCCSYQTAVDIARTERDDPMMAAQKLRDFAISYGADGSVMVMVINISDLFFGRNNRPRTATTGAPAPDVDGDVSLAGTRRNMRRRYEEVGDRTLNRLQQEIEPPQGQVALVFTDIVNSTVLWETNPGMPSSIKIHHNLFRRQLRLDGGYEVKTEGDAFMVAFQSVLSALLWSFNCQILLLQQEWPSELLTAKDGQVIYDSEGNLIQRGLRVRMGVHWGTPNCERDPITRRMDYYGPMVNRAARIQASADGGQLMASQDVISEISAIRDYLESLDEEGLIDLPQELKREVQELKLIGLEVKEMGERKLKGLEVPEKLHLLYPKVLSGRFEISSNINQKAEVQPAPPVFVRAPNMIDSEEVRELAALCLRLEALTSPSFASVLGPSPLNSPRLVASPTPDGHTSPSRHSRLVRRVEPPVYLGPIVHDEMTDEELSMIIESLTTRLENSLSTLLGGFSSVLAALEQATRVDQRLLVHAMSLMNGMMNADE